MRIPAIACVAFVLVAGCSSGAKPDAAAPSTTLVPTTTTTPPERLTRHYACGFTIAAGNADQTLGVFLRLANDTGTDPDIPAHAALTGPEWHTTVRTGSDLFANWCTDVIFEPAAQVSAEVPVTSGAIDVTGDLFQVCSGTVHADLTGVVAESAEGETIDLGDVSIDAGGWLCFPG